MRRKNEWMVTAFTVLLGCMMSGNAAMAFAPEPDLMKIKGYSPEVIYTSQTTRSRMEWRVPPVPTLSPLERFIHNIYYNQWIGSMDEFGSQIIRYRD